MATRFLLKVLIGSATVVGACHAANWYESEKRSCDFASPVAITPPFSLSKLTSGGYYYSIQKSDINKILDAPNSYVRSENKLSPAAIKKLKADAEKLASSNLAGSAALSVANAIVDYSGAYSTPAGLLLSWLSEKLEAAKINADRLIDMISIGGEAGYDVAFHKPTPDLKPLALVLTHYQIQVGEEPTKRKWLFSACLLPVEIVLSEVTTTGGLNDKRLNRTSDGTWTQWDITDGKFDSYKYRYVEQDQFFAYFEKIDETRRRYRIHLYDGPMQQETQEGEWRSLYLTTKSK